MASVPGFDSDPRPELPRVFPDGEVTVEGERKTFEESRTDNSTQPKLVYLLDKAPVKRIVSVQGVDQNGENRTFQEGIDYELADLLQTFDETFVFRSQQDRYKLDRKVDSGSISIRDEGGTDYTEGVEFVLVQDGDGKTDTVVWQDGEDRPNVDDRFTASYERTSPNSAIEWDESGDNLPRVGRTFFVTYVADSILNRYIDVYDEEFTDIKEAIDSAVSNKFVDTADSDSLNELGELFGPVIGKRRGRTDEQYRVYLKSVVQSFISRGTKSGIKLAISAATDVPIEDIEIRENFQQNSYEIVVLPNTAVTVSLIENVSEIADPSGVEQALTRFPIDEEEVNVDDRTIVREPVETDADGTSTEDNTLVDDNKNTLDEQLTSDDEARVNDDLLSALEEFLSDDAAVIDGNLSTIVEGAVMADTIDTPSVRKQSVVATGDVVSDVDASNKNAHFWEDDKSPDVTAWNFAEWANIIDLAVGPLADTTSADDALAVDDGLSAIGEDTGIADTTASTGIVQTESTGSGDGFGIDANRFTNADASSADDAVNVVPSTDGLIVEDAGSGDTVTGTSVTPIAWDTNDWSSFNWTVEHN